MKKQALQAILMEIEQQFIVGNITKEEKDKLIRAVTEILNIWAKE